MTSSDIPEKFSCKRCGACCRWEGAVKVEEDEVDAIAAFLNMSVEEFLEHHTRLTPDRQHLSLLEEEIPQSIQHTSALKEFTIEKNILKTALNTHIHSACRKLRLHGLLTSKIGVMLRTKDFQVFSISQELTESTNFELEIQKTVFELFEQIFREGILYRSTGVTLADFESEDCKQLTLLDRENDKKDSLAKCIDKIESKFGKNKIRTGF